MSDFETLLTAWLNGGTIPADFKPTSNVEEYLLAILNGVDDDVDPKSRADVLLDAIATKYAGYSDGLEELRDVSGITAHHVPGGYTPEEVAAFLRAINTTALQDLAAKGATGVSDNTTDILWAYRDLPSGGAELNIAYGDTAPEDTSKLWVKTAQPQNVTVDYDLDNGVESVQAQSATLPTASADIACGVVGKKIYLIGAGASTVRVYDTETNTVTSAGVSFPYGKPTCGVVGAKIYIFGGQLNLSGQTSIKVFDTENNTITNFAASLPKGLYNVSCGVVGTKIYLFGGYTGTKEVDTIYVCDTENNTLTTLPVTLPTAARYGGACVVGTKIYLCGGWNGNAPMNTINVFDTTTNTISTLQTTLPTGVYAAGASTFGNKCYLMGGRVTSAGDPPSTDAIVVFDAETETVTTSSATLPQPLFAAGIGTVASDAYIFGGASSQLGFILLDTIYKFTVTFPLAEGDVYLQSDVFRNKFALITAPTEVKTGVSAVYVGNASNYAETAEAYLHDGTQWQQI